MATTAFTKSDLLPEPILTMLRPLMPDVYRLLPRDITDDQFRAACWLEITGRPDLHTCVLDSLRDAIIDAANKGLMPGRDCHFLGFKQKKYGGVKGAICVPNYFGIIRTLDRSGKVRRAFAHPVQVGDEWGFDYFADRPIHKPAITLGKQPGKELFYYGAVMFLDGTCAFEVMTLDDLDQVRRRAPAHENGPWVSDPVMMKRKSALKRVAKYVQLTPDARQLLDEDDAREKEDISPARHRANLVDLFGDAPGPTQPTLEAPRNALDETREDAGAVQETTLQETRTQTTRQKRRVPTEPPEAPPAVSSAGLWRETLRAHRREIARLEHEADPKSTIHGLSEKIEQALREREYPDSEGHALADAVLDWLD